MRLSFHYLVAASFFGLVSSALVENFAWAQAGGEAGLPGAPVPVDPVDRDMITLSSSGERAEQWENFLDQTMVRNIDQAGLYPVLPDPGKANGKSVIVVPGGGFMFVALQNEGFPVAERLADEGYATFVLKYRTEETPRAPEDFLQFLAARFASFGKRELDVFSPAVEDFRAAISYVSETCPCHGCRPGPVNVIGFSAGGLSVLQVLDDRPAGIDIETAALIYPPMTSSPDKDAYPPVFLAIAADDPLFQQGGFDLPAIFLERADQFEFHLYGSGGHGFGMLRKGATSELWLDQYVRWLEVLNSGQLGPPESTGPAK